MKINKKILLTSIISAVLASTISVAAVTLSAKEIGFTSTDSEWLVENVEDAVNDLYQISSTSSINRILLGTITYNTCYGDNGNYSTYTYDISEYGEGITTENIFLDFVSYSIGSSTLGTGSTDPASMSFQKSISDGTLTVKIPIVTYNWNPRNIGLSNAVINVYLVY